jgi:hypothetical protein
VRAWLAANLWVIHHFTRYPRFLNDRRRNVVLPDRMQALHRGAFPSVRDLMIKIRTFINGWNDRCQPFAWTKTPDLILTKANRKTTSVAVH